MRRMKAISRAGAGALRVREKCLWQRFWPACYLVGPSPGCAEPDPGESIGITMGGLRPGGLGFTKFATWLLARYFSRPSELLPKRSRSVLRRERLYTVSDKTAQCGSSIGTTTCETCHSCQNRGSLRSPKARGSISMTDERSQTYLHSGWIEEKATLVAKETQCITGNKVD